MNPYQILGISTNATENEIKKAYYKLVNAYHPDIHPENKAYYEEKMKQINKLSHQKNNFGVRVFLLFCTYIYKRGSL